MFQAETLETLADFFARVSAELHWLLSPIAPRSLSIWIARIPELLSTSVRISLKDFMAEISQQDNQTSSNDITYFDDIRHIVLLDAGSELQGNGSRFAHDVGRTAPKAAWFGATALESEFYLQARREWDERYGDLVLGKRNWQITSAGLMLLSLILALGIVWMSARSKV